MNIPVAISKDYIASLIVVALLAGGCGSDNNGEKNQLIKIGPVISSSRAREIFEKIDHRLNFTIKSTETLGVIDYLYYADLMEPDSQVTINIGKREDDNAPFTSLYVHVMALAPMEKDLKQKLEGYVAKYIYGFLSEAFVNGSQLVEKITSGVQTVPSLIGEKSVILDSENYELNYELGEGDKNPAYFNYELRIMFKPYQEELNKRFKDHAP